MKHFSTFTGAGIPPGFACSRIAQQTDHLRTDVLNFELARVKFRPSKKIFVTLVKHRVRQCALAATRWSRMRDAELLGQGASLARSRPQP
jgi:hypothetical protein